jgi:hypothetical protein
MSLSEPDAASQFAHLRATDGSRDVELSRLLDGALRFLFKPTGIRAPQPTPLSFVAKGFRSWTSTRRPSRRRRTCSRIVTRSVLFQSFYRLFTSFGVPEREPLSEWTGFFMQQCGKDADDLRFYLGEDNEANPC